MQLNIRLLALLLCSLIIFSACEEEKLVLSDRDAGYQYYPVEEGKFWIYQVDSIIVPGFNLAKLESTSFIKEEITQSFINSQGDTTYIIQRSISDDQNGQFTPTDRWTLEKTDNSLFRTEENLLFLKMVFPINVGDTWDGNKFDEKVDVFVAQERVEVYKEWDYEILSKNVSINIAGTDYTEVVEMQQANFVSDTDQRLSEELYAPDVGLIYRKMEIFDTQCFDPCAGQAWIDKANKGFYLEQTLVDHN